MAMIGGVAARSDTPVLRFDGWELFEFTIDQGAWDEWMASDTWLGLGYVLMDADHLELSDQIMASTANDTLSFGLVQADGFEHLTFEADFLADDDPDKTDYMARMEKQIRSGRIKQVSMGMLIMDYKWDHASQTGAQYDRLHMIKGAGDEVATVSRGAQGDAAYAQVMRQALAAGDNLADIRPELRGAGVKLKQRLGSGEIADFDVRATRLAAREQLKADLAAKEAATMAQQEADKPVRSPSAERDRLRQRHHGGF